MELNPISFEVKYDDMIHQADALVIFISEQEQITTKLLHPQLDYEIEKLLTKGMFRGQSQEVHMLPTYGLITCTYIMLVGIGTSLDAEGLRHIGAVIARAANKHMLEKFAIDLTPLLQTSPSLKEEHVIQGITEGIHLGIYTKKSYKKDKKMPFTGLCNVLYILVGHQQHILLHQRAIDIAKAHAAGTNYARDLTNLPSNMLKPNDLAEQAQALSVQYGFTCDILDEEGIQELGMGGLYAVGRGSSHPPRMIVMKYQGTSEWTNVLGLVGKGITFDTGGISLKKAAGMEEMISDMGGAAAVMGVMQAVGQLRPAVNLLAVIPSAENMPSSTAYKPGDIVTTLSGRTVEVLNTDAEGRIVLADAITYAMNLGADKLIDISTLTGAVLVALGDVATGAVTNDEAFLEQLVTASKRAGEKVWQLPNYPEFKEMIKSDVADVKNSSGRYGAAITAGLFIGSFTENTPWIHLDIGGTAWLWKGRGYQPKGGTGVMVRTILQMIEHQ